MKKNKKGFAFSTMLYGTTAIIAIVLYIILNIVKTSRDTTYYYGEQILKELNNCVKEEMDLENCYSSGNVNCDLTSYRACLGISDNMGDNNGIIVSEFLKGNVTESGDGLYVDQYTNGRYIYRGNTVNNYMLYSGKNWRILSIEPLGDLLLVDVDATIEKQWDVDSHGEWNGSSLRSFLNNDYLSLIFDQSKVKEKKWYLSYVYPTSEPNLVDLIKQETLDGEAMSVTDKVGILSISDYMKATMNTLCQENVFNSESCNSWLSNYKGWTNDVNGEINNTGVSFLFDSGNKIIEEDTSESHRLYPVIVLDRNSIIRSGNGTQDNPYSLYSETNNQVSPTGQQQVIVTPPTVNSNTLIYDGTSKVIAGSAGSCGPGGIMYYYTQDYNSSLTPNFSTSTWTTTYPSNASATNTGTYYMWYYCYVSDTANYFGNDINKAKFVTKQIFDRELSVIPPTVNSNTLIYDGTSKVIAGSAGSCGSGGVMYYYTASYTLTNPPSFNPTTWTTTYPSNASATIPGTYNMWYYCYVNDSSNNTGNEINIARKVSKDINRRSLTITANQQIINYGNDINKTTSYVSKNGLISGHSLTNINLTPSTLNATTEGSIEPSNAVIKDSSNNNVTNYYDINYNTGHLIVNRVEAVINCVTPNRYENSSPQVIATCTGGTVNNASQTVAGTYQITCTGDSNHLNATQKNCTLNSCSAGYYSGDGSYCNICQNNTYSSTNGSSSCLACDVENGYTSGQGATYCCKATRVYKAISCTDGYYPNNHTGQSCGSGTVGQDIFTGCVNNGDGNYYCRKCSCTLEVNECGKRWPPA